jgi:hypothetical protein
MLMQASSPHVPIREAWLAQVSEEILGPGHLRRKQSCRTQSDQTTLPTGTPSRARRNTGQLSHNPS